MKLLPQFQDSSSINLTIKLKNIEHISSNNVGQSVSSFLKTEDNNKLMSNLHGNSRVTNEKNHIPYELLWIQCFNGKSY